MTFRQLFEEWNMLDEHSHLEAKGYEARAELII